MSEFTKEEISLCKQIAERHRKEVKYGDWYIHLDQMLLWTMPAKMTKEDFGTASSLDYVIPLWTISDCLEFLREKYKEIRFNEYKHGVGVSVFPKKELEEGEGEHGNTPLEACLKVVLAVLEERK